jgi:hypothetical protein
MTEDGKTAGGGKGKCCKLAKKTGSLFLGGARGVTGFKVLSEEGNLFLCDSHLAE